MSERIDSVRIDADEDGYHLVVSTDDGEHDLRFGDTDTARQLIVALDGCGLRDWVADHDRELAAYLVASPAERSRVLGHALELDDDPDAYEERAEAMRDAGDLTRKADRERGPDAIGEFMASTRIRWDDEARRPLHRLIRRMCR